MASMESRRVNMVNSQILTNRVTDERIAEAMLAVPRELFVPKPLRGVAYVDEDIALGHGRYLMEPMIFARLLQAAEVRESDVVLDLACGTGYSTAVLARLAGSVVGLESDEGLAARANDLLTELAIDNAAVIVGDLPAGRADQGPFDVIFINGAVDELPESLTDQLAEGGRLVGVVPVQGVGKARLYRRVHGIVGSRELFDAQVPALPGFEREIGFVF